MIEISHLSKRYGALAAVDDVSFEVRPGEVLGFLGPNGAGKSTTMKMITGFISPTAGTVRVCGHDVEQDPLAAKARMGYLPEGAPSYGEMTVRAFLEFIADVRELRGERRRSRFDDVVARLALEAVLEQPIETLSKGFRRRVGLAQAILHDPQVLILDEPTDGLDPNQKHEVRDLINGMAADKIIVVSTHILEEVHAMCTRAIIIAGGRLLADDTPRGLEARSRYHEAVTVRIDDPSTLAVARDLIAELNGVASVEVVERERRLTAFPKHDMKILADVSAIVARESLPVRELHLESGRLDEVFRAITNPNPATARVAEEAAHA